MNGQGKTWHEQTQYATEDKTSRVLVRSGLRRKVIALDNALVEQQARLNGDFLYADALSTGSITLKLNNTSEDPIPFSSQSSIEEWPIEDVFISCAAQPGKVLNLWYGWRARIRPPQNVVQLLGSVDLTTSAFGVPAQFDKDAFNGHAWYAASTQALVAGQNACLGIANPTGSGKDVYIDRIQASSSIVGSLFVQSTTDNGLGTDLFAVIKKIADGTTLNAHIRGANNNLGLALANPGMSVAVQAGVTYDLIDNASHSIYVPPGRCLAVYGINAAAITASFEGREY